MKTNPTYEDICNDFQLWQQYVDTNGFDTEESFNAQTIAQKREFMVSCFGHEKFDEIAAD